MPDANTPILHHYPSSPFSEKVRLAFGIKGVHWASVHIPMMAPKPDLIPLTGGYRLTPVLQIGSDIYCDTQLILRELDRRYPQVPLITPALAGFAPMISMWSDRAFFQTSIPVIFGSTGYNLPAEFAADREQLSGRPFDQEAMARAAPRMRDQWRAHASWVEAQLAGTGSDWLSGGSPGLIDLHAHMNFWFAKNAHRPAYDALIAATPLTEAWVERVEAIGHATFDRLDAAAALQLAQETPPIPRTGGVDPREAQGLRAGDLISINADDYGRDPISGTLVYSDVNEIAIQRGDPAVGEVIVHFPRVGYTARRT
ncbi:MAG: glutathione S-transferase family protein [Hyphomonadaceae bacterium]|jgi:glutathione S-transferase|nr:glutathione S-transferase family protein [Hyphomonadaceae bacterium]